MNTNTQKWILTSGATEALTYQVYEDNAGGLHMLIYRETLSAAELIGACLNILPEDIEPCIDGLDEWRSWEGLVNIAENEAGLDQIRDLCICVEETRIETLGLTLVTRYNLMGNAAKQAFKFRIPDVFGGRQDAPAYAEPILRDFISGGVSAKYSKLCKVYGFSEPVSRVKFSGDTLYSYITPIAVIDHKVRVLVIRGMHFSPSTSRLQNAVENLAISEGFDVYYSSPYAPLDKVFA